MSVSAADTSASTYRPPSLLIVIPVLGVTQIFAFGSSYYLLAVLAQPIASDTGWPLAWVIGGLSLGLLVAGIVSPRVGDSIQRLGSRLVLATSAVFMALGLAGLALSPNLPLYIMSWLVLGVGMGAGLYDAAFATLGRLYGQRARTAIATLTLFGGFASTVCWPLSALFVSEFGWRNACLVYAAIHVAVLLPLYVFALPTEPKRDLRVAAPSSLPDGEGVTRFARLRLETAVRADRACHHDQLDDLRDAFRASAHDPASRPNRPEAAILANLRNNPRTSRLVLLGLEEHGDVFGGKFEASAVGNSLSGDRVAWPLWIYAGDPEPFASGAELASEVRRGQSEVLCQELEPVFFRD
ncbi:MFS transporter [Mesorhizobium sp.]|uniref:MFS transporter n=1 Tax=Mesorhizobium sp. TaxID=1871066 RepID=UPI0025BF581E|nr:MFS transporter [Mesorhizobium sp.]